MTRVVLVKVDRPCEVSDLDGFNQMKAACGMDLAERVGYAFPGHPGLVAYVDDEGLINGSGANRAIHATADHAAQGFLDYTWERKARVGDLIAIIFGNFFVAREDDEGFADVTDEDIELVTSTFADTTSGLRGVLEVKLGCTLQPA